MGAEKENLEEKRGDSSGRQEEEMGDGESSKDLSFHADPEDVAGPTAGVAKLAEQEALVQPATRASRAFVVHRGIKGWWAM